MNNQTLHLKAELVHAEGGCGTPLVYRDNGIVLNTFIYSVLT